MGLDTNARFAEALAAAEALQPDALVLTGDFCGQDPNEEVYRKLRPQLDATGLPYFLSPGNHDSRALLRKHFRLPGRADAPIYGRVAIAERDYYFLDTSPGELETEQLDWLEAELDPDRPAEIFMHHPPFALGVRFMDERYQLSDSDGRLAAILASGGRERTVFCGHYHSYRTVRRGKVTVHLCPPTSFYIDPLPESFRLEELPPAIQLIEYDSAESEARVVPRFLVPSRSA